MIIRAPSRSKHRPWRQRAWALGALAAVLLTASAPSAGAAGPGSDLAEMSIEELINLPVYSASKRPQAPAQAPAAVYVITRDDIERFGYRTLADALKTVSGFHISNDRNYHYLGVRGFSRPYDLNTRVLLLLDGHRLNDPNFDYAPLGEDLPVDLDAVERIEIIKGPGSALWGTNALFAIINLITKKPAGSEGGQAIADFGSHERFKGFAALAGQTAGQVGYSGSAGYVHSNGERHIFFPTFDDPSTNSGVSEHEDGERAFRALARVEHEGAELFVNTNYRRKEIPTASFGTAFNTDDSYTNDGSFRMEGALERNIDEAGSSKILARIYYDLVKYYGDYAFDGGLAERSIFRDNGSSQLIGTELRFSSELRNDLSLLTGVELQRAYELSLEYFRREPSFQPVLDTENTIDLQSFYAELDYNPIEPFHMIGGVRLDNYSTFDLEVSPRFAAVYAFDAQTVLKLLYGEAFRAPNNFERNYEDSQKLLGNEDLDPETIRTLEAVLESRIGSGVTTALSVFRLDIDDIITQVPVGDALQFRNTASVTSQGVELQINGRLADGASGYLAGSFLEAADDADDARLSNSPRKILNLGLSVPFWEKRFYLSPEVQYLGDRKTRTGGTIGGATVTNVQLRAETGIEALELGAGVYNLFDKETASPGAGEHRQETLPYEGRSFRMRLDYKF